MHRLWRAITLAPLNRFPIGRRIQKAWDILFNMDFMTFCPRSQLGGDIRSFISVGRIWRQKNGRKSELWRQARWRQGYQEDRGGLKCF